MLEHIKVSNLLPFYGEQEVSFPSGLVSVEGTYTGDAQKSNRAGKTALFDLVRFAIFGAVRGAKEKTIINKLADVKKDPCYVSIELSHPDKDEHLTITRQYDAKTNSFQLYVPELETEGATKKQIQQMLLEELSLSEDTSYLTWMIRQSKSLGLMDPVDFTAKKRKEFMIETFSMNSTASLPWEAYHNEASSRYNTVTTQISNLLANRTNLKAEVESLEARDYPSMWSVMEHEVEELSQKKESVAVEISKKQEELPEQKLIEVNSTLYSRQQSLSSLKSKIVYANKQVGKFEKQVKKKEDLIRQIRDTKDWIDNHPFDEDEFNTLLEESERLYSKVSEYTTKINVANNDLVRVDGFDGICPLTRKECSDGQSVQQYAEELKRSLATMEKELNKVSEREEKLNLQVDKLEKKRNELKQMESTLDSFYSKLDDLENAHADLEEWKEFRDNHYAEQDELRSEIKSLEAQSRELQAKDSPEAKAALKSLQNQYSTLVSDIKHKRDKIQELKIENSKVEQKKSQLTQTDREIKMLEKRQTSLRVVKQATSVNGIPFYTLLSAISDFEIEVNRALTELGSSIRVVVEPYQTLSSYSETCNACGYHFGTSQRTTCPLCNTRREHKRKETIRILLTGNKVDVDYDEDSGGGMLLVAMAIRFALFSVYKTRGYMGWIDFFVMDEVFAPLDISNRNKMLSFMDSLRSVYGLHQLFVTSHTDVSDVIPPAVVIERDAEKEYSILAG